MKLFVSVLLTSGSVFAQSFQGSLRGRVTDPKRALTPNTKLTITDEATKLGRSLPLGRGKPFFSINRILDYAVGGWSANAFGVAQTEYPLSVTQSNNNSVIGASYQRPNATGISPVTSGSTEDRINGWLNPAAFSQAPQFTFGNISRFLDVRGPGLFNVDLSLFKSFSIKERVKAQFRAEALNSTNTVYFGTPNTTLTSSNFGLITSQINNPRLVQLGVRATF